MVYHFDVHRASVDISTIFKKGNVDEVRKRLCSLCYFWNSDCLRFVTVIFKDKYAIIVLLTFFKLKKNCNVHNNANIDSLWKRYKTITEVMFILIIIEEEFAKQISPRGGKLSVLCSQNYEITNNLTLYHTQATAYRLCNGNHTIV